MDIDALFQLPLAEFTAARNTLATRLKKAGRAAEADQVRALPKPSLSAWAVNQVYWTDRAAFDRLLDAGARFRAAQAEQLAGRGGDVRGTLGAQRDALTACTALAVKALRDAGSPATPDMTRRITTTLEALATYGRQADGPRPGHLTDDVSPPGFEALAALVPQLGRSKDSAEPTRVIPFTAPASTRPAASARGRASRQGGAAAERARRREHERRAALAAATTAVTVAERTLRAARAAVRKAEAALKAAARRAKDAEREKQAVERRYEKVTAAFEAARGDARRIAGAAEQAAQAVDDAERGLARAARALAAARGEA